MLLLSGTNRVVNNATVRVDVACIAERSALKIGERDVIKWGLRLEFCGLPHSPQSAQLLLLCTVRRPPFRHQPITASPPVSVYLLTSPHPRSCIIPPSPSHSRPSSPPTNVPHARLSLISLSAWQPHPYRLPHPRLPNPLVISSGALVITRKNTPTCCMSLNLASIELHHH